MKTTKFIPSQSEKLSIHQFDKPMCIQLYKVACDSRYLYWSSSGDDICLSVSQKILQCPFGMSDFLKHHQYFSQRFKLGRNLYR